MFIEVGAYDGVSFSNTSCLAAAGWSGLLIEPVPEYAARCRTHYADNPRIEVLECAVGDVEGRLDLHLADALSTANASLFDEYGLLPWSRRHVDSTSTVSVAQQRLDAILDARDIPVEFDLLVVDVEGFESRVFAGFDLYRWQPAMIIVELADTHPDLTATRQSDAKLSRVIREAGYDIVFKDMVNTVFVRTDVALRAAG
jgi:FkbM family methyltransferase